MDHRARFVDYPVLYIHLWAEKSQYSTDFGTKKRIFVSSWPELNFDLYAQYASFVEINDKNFQYRFKTLTKLNPVIGHAY